MRVEIRGLSFTYGGRVPLPVLRGLDLTVESHSVHAIVGPNGCGKTTLLRVMGGLARPSAGSIRFVGENLHANTTAMVFQDPTLLPWWTVGRNVAISAEMRGEPKERYEKVRDFHSRQVGLGDEIDLLPHELSRGMQTKAGFGRALAHDADVLLLDEPFVHLDAVTRRASWEELETHWQLDPRTYVFVTHDVEEAVYLSDRVSVMTARPGRILETVEVDVPRPRTFSSQQMPGSFSATSRVWEALKRAASI